MKKYKLKKENEELWNKTNEVLNEAYSELRNFENMALEKFRELAEIKNRIDNLCQKISEIQLKIIEIDNRK